MSIDKAQARALSDRMNDAQIHAGVMASMVADYLAEEDLEAARAALPAYLEARMQQEQLGLELVQLAGLEDVKDAG